MRQNPIAVFKTMFIETNSLESDYQLTERN